MSGSEALARQFGRRHLADVTRGVLRVLQTGALVGEGLADELLPHILNARSARNAAHPTERVRPRFVAQRHADLLERKEPAFKHFEHFLDPIRGDGHRTSHGGSERKHKGYAKQTNGASPLLSKHSDDFDALHQSPRFLSGQQRRRRRAGGGFGLTSQCVNETGKRV